MGGSSLRAWKSLVEIVTAVRRGNANFYNARLGALAHARDYLFGKEIAMKTWSDDSFFAFVSFCTATGS